MHKTKQQNQKNFCMEEKAIIWIDFNPGLALTGFGTTLPCFQQVNLTWARNRIENQHLVSGQLQKAVTSMSCRLETAIWSRDTGQQIPCFYRCQLIRTWMSNIKEVDGKKKAACLCQPIIWRMAAILRDSTVVTIGVAITTVMRTHPRAIPLAMISTYRSWIDLWSTYFKIILYHFFCLIHQYFILWNLYFSHCHCSRFLVQNRSRYFCPSFGLAKIWHT